MSGISSLSRLIRDPVATSADLPIGDDVQGAIRVVLSDSSVWVYDGVDVWTQSGGGPVPSGALDNITIYLNGSSKIAVKPLGITDGLISNAASIIHSWDAARPYTVGQVAMSSGGLWLCRVAGTNLPPNLATNNWRQLANIDSAQNLTFTPVVTTTATMLRSQTSIMAKFTTADYTVTLPTIASLVGASGDTNGRVQEFKIFKRGQTNKLTIRCGGADTYADGTTAIDVTAGGTLTRLFASFSESQWFRG